jgi:signal transduction histidine kinase
MKISLESKIIGGFAFSLVILVIIAFVSFRSLNIMTVNTNHLNHSQEVLSQLSMLLSSITEAESAQRSYLLTMDDSYLAERNRIVPRVSATLSDLDRLMTEPNEREQLKRLGFLADWRIKRMDSVMEIRRTIGIDAAVREIETGKGLKIFRQIAKLVHEMKRHETLLIESRELEAGKSLLFMKVVILSGAFLALIVCIAALCIAHRGFGRIKRAEAEVSLRNEQLVRVNAEKDRFFSIISHDLLNPFQTFLGYTSILAEDFSKLSEEEMRTLVLRLKLSANRLFILLENLLQWSLLQRDLMTFHPESFNLQEGIASQNDLLRVATDKKGIALNLFIPPDLTMMVDKAMFESLVRNLVLNAVKFTNQGGEISISGMQAAGNFVQVSVKDTGIGMSREIAENLFRLDVQTNRKGTDGEPSTGLGLILCRDFVEKHGGKLWVESEEGRGSVFHFTLPGS